MTTSIRVCPLPNPAAQLLTLTIPLLQYSQPVQVAASSELSPIRPAKIKMTERKLPPRKTPDDKGSQEASPTDKTTKDSGTPAKEVPMGPNTQSTNESQNGLPHPNDDLLEKIKWVGTSLLILE